MSGADLRNLVNEAALLVVREGSKEVVKQNHFETCCEAFLSNEKRFKVDMGCSADLLGRFVGAVHGRE
jgi:ATP-dependent Zn protease